MSKILSPFLKEEPRTRSITGRGIFKILHRKRSPSFKKEDCPKIFQLILHYLCRFDTNIYQNLIRDFECIEYKNERQFSNIFCMIIFLKYWTKHWNIQSRNMCFYSMKVDFLFLDLIFFWIM